MVMWVLQTYPIRYYQRFSILEYLEQYGIGGLAMLQDDSSCRVPMSQLFLCTGVQKVCEKRLWVHPHGGRRDGAWQEHPHQLHVLNGHLLGGPPWPKSQVEEDCPGWDVQSAAEGGGWRQPDPHNCWHTWLRRCSGQFKLLGTCPTLRWVTIWGVSGGGDTGAFGIWHLGSAFIFFLPGGERPKHGW